jgi:hypothetical protein
MSIYTVNPNTVNFSIPGAPRHNQLIAAPQREYQREPGIVDKFALGLGSGIGEGIQGGVKEHMRRSMLDKVLNQMNPRMSAVDKYKMIAMADPEIQPYLQQVVQAEETARQADLDRQQAQNYQSGIESVLGGGMQQPQQFSQGTEENSLISQLRGIKDPSQKQALIKNFQEEKKIRQGQEKEAFSYNKDYLHDVNKRYRSASETEGNLNQMEDLARSGKLTSPLMNRAVKFFDVPLSVLGNPKNELYDKLSSQLVSGVNDAFRGQIRVVEIENFKDRIPTLMNSDEGKLLIIKQMKLAGQAAKLDKEATDYIIQQNGGVPPYDLENRVTTLVTPELQRLAEEFRQNENIVQSVNANQSSDRVNIITPDGVKGTIPREKLKQALKLGARISE